MKTELLEKAFDILIKADVKPAVVAPLTEPFVRTCEQRLGVVFPYSYREFLMRFGAVVKDDLAIFGLGGSPLLLPSVECAIRVTRAMHPDAPPGLVSFHLITTGLFACINCPTDIDPTTEPPVILWDVRRPIEEQSWERLADSFEKYFYQIVFDHFAVETALKQFESRVKEFASRLRYSHDGQGKLPRNHDWRPYRFSSQDVLLGAHVQSHIKGENVLEVDVFLPIDVEPFETGSSLLALTVNILADAYRCGSTMEIRFTENVDGGQVPRKLVALAETLNVPIRPESLAQRKLAPDDARRLFLALTDFSAPVCKRLDEMTVTPERACYVVQRGVWPKAEAEALILAYPFADRVFTGGAPPEQRTLFQQDVLYARNVILFGYLNRALTLRERELNEKETLELEDDVRQVETIFNPTAQAQTCRVFPAAGEQLSVGFGIPWLADGCTQSGQLQFGEPFVVMARACDADDLVRALSGDLAAAKELHSTTMMPVFVLVPQDFYESSLHSQRLSWVKQANEAGVSILVCAQTLEGLEDEAYQRFTQSRIVRE